MAQLFALYSALKNQVKKDQTEERKQIFYRYLSSFPLMLTGYTYADRWAPVSVKCLFGLARASVISWPHFQGGEKGIFSVSRSLNETNKIAEVQSVISGLDLGSIRWDLSKGKSFAFFLFLAFRRPQNFLKTWRVLRRFFSRYPLYIALRCSETLLCFIALKYSLQRQGAKLPVSSSDGNPHGLATMAVASNLKIAHVFLSHGPQTARPIRLKTDLGIFYGERSLASYQAEKSIIRKSLFYPREQATFKKVRVFSDVRRVCVCLGMGFHPERTQKLLEDIQVLAPQMEVLVRPHPSLPQTARALRRDLVFSFHPRLKDALADGSILLAGNSTAHLEAMRLGIYSFCFPILESGNPETPSFLKEKMVPIFSDFKSLIENFTSALEGADSSRGRLDEYFHPQPGNFHEGIRTYFYDFNKRDA